VEQVVKSDSAHHTEYVAPTELEMPGGMRTTKMSSLAGLKTATENGPLGLRFPPAEEKAKSAKSEDTGMTPGHGADNVFSELFLALSLVFVVFPKNTNEVAPN
jgi:hypothetical protein